ncbi:hypothetical protein FJZ26_04625 [Candidatus Parvarchaeota archaeon]|nr:hypothetical protein [Candidatus Parvarchaeota archaeon]
MPDFISNCESKLNYSSNFSSARPAITMFAKPITVQDRTISSEKVKLEKFTRNEGTEKSTPKHAPNSKPFFHDFLVLNHVYVNSMPNATGYTKNKDITGSFQGLKAGVVYSDWSRGKTKLRIQLKTMLHAKSNIPTENASRYLFFIIPPSRI